MQLTLGRNDFHGEFLCCSLSLESAQVRAVNESTAEFENPTITIRFVPNHFQTVQLILGEMARLHLQPTIRLDSQSLEGDSPAGVIVSFEIRRVGEAFLKKAFAHTQIQTLAEKISSGKITFLGLASFDLEKDIQFHAFLATIKEGAATYNLDILKPGSDETAWSAEISAGAVQ